MSNASIQPVTLLDTSMLSVPLEYEKVYQIPKGDAFRAVNGAVAHALWRLGGAADLDHDDVDGGTKYTIVSMDGIIAHLFVIYLSEHYANVRLSVLAPLDPDEGAAWMQAHANADTTIRQYAALFDACHNDIVTQLRRAARLENDIPPPPPSTELDAVFTWQGIYHPEMRDKELALLIGCEHQTIRNARRDLNQPKRVPRGKLREA